MRRILHAEAIEPLSLQIRLCVGRCYYFARRYDQACYALAGILKSEPGHFLTTNWLARTLCAMGRHAEALGWLEQLPPDQQTPYVQSVMAYALAGLGRTVEACALCVSLDQELEKGRGVAAFVIGARALLGDRGVALELLEKSVGHRHAFLPWLASEPAYDPIRDDPRFQELLAELRLKPAASADPSLSAAVS